MFHAYSGPWGNPFLLQGTLSLLYFITPANTLVHLVHSYPLFTSQFRHLLLLQEASSEPHHLLNSCNACKSLLIDSELQEIKLFFYKSTHITLCIPFTVRWKFSFNKFRALCVHPTFSPSSRRNIMLRCQE